MGLTDIQVIGELVSCKLVDMSVEVGCCFGPKGSFLAVPSSSVRVGLWDVQETLAKLGSNAPTETDLGCSKFANAVQDEVFACACSDNGHALLLCLCCGHIVQGSLLDKFECNGLEVCCLVVSREQDDWVDLSGVVFVEHDFCSLAILSGCQSVLVVEATAVHWGSFQLF